MRVFNNSSISYTELLKGIKLLVDENGNNEAFVSKARVDDALNYMLALKNKNTQKILTSGITNIDARISDAFENDLLFDAFHKLPLIVSLIRIVKEGGDHAIKDFTPEQASTLAAVTWSSPDEIYSKVVAIYIWKQILDRLLEKSQNINDNLLLALEVEKLACVSYKGDLKMQIIRMCEVLDTLDDKTLHNILDNGVYRKR